MSEIPTENQLDLQDQLLNTVEEELHVGHSYLMLLTSSAVIATFGLLINSPSVVIGAMLIAPLFWPVMGLTLSVITTRRHLLKKSLVNLTISITLVILLSAVLAKLTPLATITEEISIRTNPTLFDLLIALASSVIGVSAAYYPKISSSATGVALSLALLPPLCVSGIGLALGNWDVFWGATLLFATNVGAIIFAGIVTLYLLKVRPRFEHEKKRWQLGLIVSSIVLILLSVPLTIYLSRTIQQTKDRQMIRSTLTEQLSTITDQVQIENFSVAFRPEGVDVEGTVYLPEGISLTKIQQDELIKKLSNSTQQTVDLKLNVVNTVVLRQEDDEYLRSIRSQASNIVNDWIREHASQLGVEQITVVADPDAGSLASAPLSIEVTLKQFSGESLSFDQKQQLNSVLTQQLSRSVNLQVEIIPVTRVMQPDEQKKLETKIKTTLTQDLHLFSPDIQVGEVTLTEQQENENALIVLAVTATVFVPENFSISAGQKQILVNHLQQQAKKSVNLELRLLRYVEQ